VDIHFKGRGWIHDNKGREVCCKVSLYKNCQRQSCSAVNCLLSGINILAGERPLPPWNLGSNWPTPPEGNEFGHILPCSTSAVRDRKRSSITLDKNHPMSGKRQAATNTTLLLRGMQAAAFTCADLTRHSGVKCELYLQAVVQIALISFRAWSQPPDPTQLDWTEPSWAELRPVGRCAHGLRL